MHKNNVLDEPILEDDYPVYAGYWYIADDKVITSDIRGNVGQLKRYLNAKEIRRCDAVKRNLSLW